MTGEKRMAILKRCLVVMALSLSSSAILFGEIVFKERKTVIEYPVDGSEEPFYVTVKNHLVFWLIDSGLPGAVDELSMHFAVKRRPDGSFCSANTWVEIEGKQRRYRNGGISYAYCDPDSMVTIKKVYLSSSGDTLLVKKAAPLAIDHIKRLLKSDNLRHIWRLSEYNGKCDVSLTICNPDGCDSLKFNRVNPYSAHDRTPVKSLIPSDGNIEYGKYLIADPQVEAGDTVYLAVFKTVKDYYPHLEMKMLLLNDRKTEKFTFSKDDKVGVTLWTDTKAGKPRLMKLASKYASLVSRSAKFIHGHAHTDMGTPWAAGPLVLDAILVHPSAVNQGGTPAPLK